MTSVCPSKQSGVSSSIGLELWGWKCTSQEAKRRRREQRSNLLRALEPADGLLGVPACLPADMTCARRTQGNNLTEILQ